MKNYKVIYTNDTKGKDTETTFVNADIFGIQIVKGYRYFAFYKKNSELVAVFSADNITAIYEV